ncbi:MAG: ATP-binding cassette domain-containing protein [Bacillota bacterium]|jgi:ABC-type bacteriocin/lantibiotic exporter with double-glycine peptidase domain
MMIQRKKTKRVKVPTVFQLEAAECGPASLAMILAYFGRVVSLDALRRECHISARDGSNAANIIKVAQKYGLDAQGFHMGCEQVKKQEFPVLVHWKFNHFIVLEGYGPKGFYLRDSTVGAFLEEEDSFSRHFTGIVITFKKTDRFTKVAKKEASLKNWYAYFLHPRVFFPVLLMSAVLHAVCEIALWIWIACFWQDVWMNHRTVLPVVSGMLTVAVLQGLFTFWGGYIKHLYQDKKSAALTKEVFRHLLRLPVSFFTARLRAGNRIEGAHALVKTLYAQVYDIFSDTAFVAAYAVLMFLFSPPLAGVMLGAFLIHLLFVLVTTNKKYDLIKKGENEQSIYNGVVFGLISAIETVKSLGGENAAFANFARHQAKAANDRQFIEKQSMDMAVAAQLFQYLCFSLVIGVVGLGIMHEKMTPGGWIVFYASLSGLFAKRLPFQEAMMKIKSLKNFREKIEDILKSAPDDVFLLDHADLEAGDRLKGEIDIRSLCFGYDPNSPPLTEDFSLSLKPGRMVALVGMSGSGKTTLINIIARLYRPWSGDVFFDGMGQVPREKFIRSVALVEQDASLFKGSIRDNITLWDPAIREKDIQKAVEDACMEEVIAARGGLDAPVDQWGGNFSGGERQRLEIARALARNPAVLLMDEATSALDAVTEKKILDNIKDRKCTTVIVAHRLSAVRDCDEIIVLDKGRIRERGTHHGLKKKNGMYQSLMARE